MKLHIPQKNKSGKSYCGPTVLSAMWRNLFPLATKSMPLFSRLRRNHSRPFRADLNMIGKPCLQSYVHETEIFIVKIEI
jgi:hypothetical protein